MDKDAECPKLLETEADLPVHPDQQVMLDEFLLEDVLVEEISIDGMCGVY